MHSNIPTPLVSVLMTAYNREKYISEAIESVLASTYTNFELIIVDDGSTDSTVAIAKSYAEKDSRIILYINEQNLGDYSNRNKAASYANGKYLKYVDSDDLIYPNGLEIMVKAMESFPNAPLGLISRRTQDNIPFPYLCSPKEIFESHFFYDGCLDVGPLGFIVNREKFFELGGFSGKRFVGDTEFLFNMAFKNNIVKIQAGIIFWRCHEGQEIQNERKTDVRFEATLDIYKKILLHPDFPLGKKIAKQIFKKHISSFLTGEVKSILRTGNIKKSYNRVKYLKSNKSLK